MLWIEKGDIVQLYNDGKHSKDVNLKPERPPKSLLRRPVDVPRTSSPLSTAWARTQRSKKPLVGSLTSSSRATDLYGLRSPCRSPTAQPSTQAPAQVFHSGMGPRKPINCRTTSKRSNNPFLAFTARLHVVAAVRLPAHDARNDRQTAPQTCRTTRLPSNPSENKEMGILLHGTTARRSIRVRSLPAARRFAMQKF